MPDENNHPQEDRNRFATPVEVVDFLNSKGKDGNATKCTFCGVGEIGVYPGPDRNFAAVVSAPVPNAGGLAVWAYLACCTNCGYLYLFSSAVVERQIGLSRT